MIWLYIQVGGVLLVYFTRAGTTALSSDSVIVLPDFSFFSVPKGVGWRMWIIGVYSRFSLRLHDVEVGLSNSMSPFFSSVAGSRGFCCFCFLFVFFSLFTGGYSVFTGFHWIAQDSEAKEVWMFYCCTPLRSLCLGYHCFFHFELSKEEVFFLIMHAL